MIVAWTRVEEYEQISAVVSIMQTQPTFWPSQLLFEESLLDHWMVHVNSHKLRRVTFKRTPAVNVIQNLFLQFSSWKASNPIWGVTQELFVAAGALWSIATSSSGPENQMKLHEFQISEIFSSHLIPPGAAPPSPSFGSFLAIAKNMSFTFSCTITITWVELITI